MKASTPTALTNGSANGSSINGFGPLDAIARRAATAVAVAPTLDARSQLSPSNRLLSAVSAHRSWEHSYPSVAVTVTMLRS